MSASHGSGSDSDSIALVQKGWLHELARAELHPDAEKLLQLGRSFDPEQLVEESTIDFLGELREYFSEYARIFNGYADGGARFQEIKIYSVAQTAADFMVFRNGVKLIVTNAAHGSIQLSFAQHSRGSLEVNGQELASGPPPFPGARAQASLIGHSQELLAQVGPFRDVLWTFQGERVSADQVARFYFSEFVRATRDPRRSHTANRALIEEIRSMLSEKGLNL